MNRIYTYLTQLINKINETDLFFHNTKIDTRKEYTIEHVEYLLNKYSKIMNIDTSTFVYGNSKRKSSVQKHYEKLAEYIKRLKSYTHHINVCIDTQNSYSKTDNDVTFMHIKINYITNAIESLSSAYHQLNSQRNVFPSDYSVTKGIVFSNI